jgi:hypothetical protein
MVISKKRIMADRITPSFFKTLVDILVSHASPGALSVLRPYHSMLLKKKPEILFDSLLFTGIYSIDRNAMHVLFHSPFLSENTFRNAEPS